HEGGLTLSCQDAQHLMHAYIDGELDLVRNLDIEQHLQGCHACTSAYQSHRALRSAIENGSLYFSAPATLQKRVRAAVRKADKAEPGRGILLWQWLAAGASLAIITIAIWSLVSSRTGPVGGDLLAQEIVSGHVRSLMASHLTDVPSSDQHTVKPW